MYFSFSDDKAAKAGQENLISNSDVADHIGWYRIQSQIDDKVIYSLCIPLLILLNLKSCITYVHIVSAFSDNNILFAAINNLKNVPPVAAHDGPVFSILNPISFITFDHKLHCPSIREPLSLE